MVLESYRKSETVVEVESYVSICLFAYYLTSVEIIGSGYTVYSLACPYAVTIISEGHSLRATNRSCKLSDRPSEY